LKETLEEREKSFEEYIAASDCNHTKVKTLIRIGIPHKALLKEIREQKADLLVMAAKGRSNLMDTVIGSCAQKMFRKSPIPVLSIRGQKV
jgi:nucleotide-binding universal stress UspA family protein